MPLKSQFRKFTLIVANEPYTNQLYLKKSTWFPFTFVYFDSTVFEEVQLIKNTLKHHRNLKTKQWNSLSLRLFSLASMTSWSFQTVRRMREAWKWETDVPSQSFSPKSAVKYLHVGRRKIQICPSHGRTRSVKALPQGQQRQSNPHPIPCLLPPFPPALHW